MGDDKLEKEQKMQRDAMEDVCRYTKQASEQGRKEKAHRKLARIGDNDENFPSLDGDEEKKWLFTHPAQMRFFLPSAVG